MKEKELNKDHLLLGSWCLQIIIFCGLQLGSTTKKRKSYPYDMYSGGCVLIDRTIGYMRIKHQVAINDTETFKEKLTFEREDKSQGVMINVYHTDNEIFNTSNFIEELLKNQKKIMFSGASASHQMGKQSAPQRQWSLWQVPY